MTGSIQEGDFFADRYRILKHLGDGTSGQTFEARDSLRREKVVLRILYPDLVADAGGWAGLLPSLKRLTQINDPQVMRVYDFNQWHDHVFLICEYLEGQPIEECIRDKETPVTQSTLKKWIVDILHTLARNNELTPHWALKPSNIWITPDGNIKLADFGFAGLTTDEKRRNTATLQGKALYLAPEGFNHQDRDPFKQDQFAAGRVIDELWVLWSSQATDRRASKLESKLQEIVQKLQAPRPEMRFASPAELSKTASAGGTSGKGTAGWIPRPIRLTQVQRWGMVGATFIIGLASFLLSQFPGEEQSIRSVDSSRLLVQWSAFNRERMDLLSRLFTMPYAEAARTVEDLNPSRDIEWMRRIGAFETNQMSLSEEQQRTEFQQLNEFISQRQARLQLAQNAWSALETLEERQGTLAEIQKSSADLIKEPQPPKLSNVLEQALEQLSRTLYSTATDTLQVSISETDAYLESLLEKEQRKAETAREEWHTAAESTGLPLANLARHLLQKFDAAQTARANGETAKALELWQSIVSRYRAWIEEVQQIPEPSSNSGSTISACVLASISVCESPFGKPASSTSRLMLKRPQLTIASCGAETPRAR